MPHPARRAALRALAAAADVDAVLVTDLANIRYLTGFTGSNAALLLHRDGDAASRFCTDGRYAAQAAAQVPDLEPVIERASARTLAERAAMLGVRRLGFESDMVTVEAHAGLARAAEPVTLHRVPGLTGGLRAVKDAAEVAVLRAACAIADTALADLLAAGGLVPGRTERAVALDLEARIREHGADGPAFETIVAAGVHAALPHHRPTTTALATGDLVIVDFGAELHGYHSDATRTVVLGPAAGWQREIHELVLAAQAVGRSAATAGADVVAVDATARSVIEDAGRGAQYPHGLGHGVGLELHEAPHVGPTGTGTLRTAMTITVEPGVYVPGRGGVRIEDTVVLGEAEPEVLTRSPRDLLELG